MKSTTLIDRQGMDFTRLQQLLESATNDQALFKQIVDAPFEQKLQTTLMFLGIVVFLLFNKETGMIDRVALSNTDFAKNTTDVSVIPFEEIKIPLKTQTNIIAAAIRTGKPQDTIDWRFLFNPALTAKEARINQASAGIAYSAVYPLKARDGGALIFSYYQYQQGIGAEQRDFMKKYAQMVSQALNPKQL